MTRANRLLRPLRGRRSAVLGILAVTALAASACGNVQAGSAAVVGDRRISVAQLQTATTQIQQIVDPDSGVDQARVLNWMILAPFTIPVAAANHVGASTDDAGRIFKQAAAAGHFSGTASPATLETVRGVIALNNLQGQGSRQITTERAVRAHEELVRRLRTTKIVVNPRYGSFRADQLTVQVLAAGLLPIIQAQPDWQVPTASPAPAVQTPPPSQSRSPAPSATGTS